MTRKEFADAISLYVELCHEIRAPNKSEDFYNDIYNRAGQVHDSLMNFYDKVTQNENR